MNYNKAIHILNLSRNFNYKDLKKAYYKKSLETHPDKSSNDINDSNNFIIVKEAYEYLYQYLDFNEKCKDNIQNNKKNNENDLLMNNMYNLILQYLFFYFNFFYSIIQYNNIDKVIVLKPTIGDLLLHNFYKLKIFNKYYYLPLWYNNIIIKNEFIINIKHNVSKSYLIKNKIITYNNIKYIKKNIIFIIDKNDEYYNNINNHYDLLEFIDDKFNISTFKINIKNKITFNKNQTIFYNCGCSIYPLIYIYNNNTQYYGSIKSDIIIQYN